MCIPVGIHTYLLSAISAEIAYIKQNKIKNKNIEMTDLFDNPVLCKNCEVKMKHAELIRNGFKMRALLCERCGNKIVHPADEAEYNHFLNLRHKVFKVKMRLVGNSYAVSIPKEIVDFMHEQEKMFNDIVSLAFNDARRLSLMFGENINKTEKEAEE